MKTLDLFRASKLPVPASTAWYLETLGEFRGKQELYTRQSPQKLKVLREHALIESAVSSNRIEGVSVEPSRIESVLIATKPLFRDRDEEEVRGYRDALGWIHGHSSEITFGEDALKRMHAMARGQIWDAGQYKEKDGDIIERYADGRERVRFRPTPANETAVAMAQLMDTWGQCTREKWVPRSVALAAFNLDLLCIHPFRDGNGRMARALATLVLTRSDIGEPEFCSIEEWLGANTEDYYSVLAHTGHGSWQPRSDPHLWLTFNLRAHHMQAQTVARRVDEARKTWSELDVLAQEHGLPERTLDAMFDAVLGYRVRRGGYMKRTGVTEQTATRDLTALASAGILSPHGTGRGRHYIAGEPLHTIQDRRRATRKPLRDPYPWMRAKLAEPV